MMHQYDGIIFDVDGTLWYSCHKVAKIWSAEAQKYTGRPYHWDGKTLEKEFGKTMDDIMLDLVPELSPAQRRELGERCFAQENIGLAKDPGILYPGVAETVRKLAERHRLFIVSNCQQGYIEILLDSCHLRDCFEGWLSWGETRVEKDETIHILMERYGLQNPVYVGDTQGDANSCARAGIDFVFAAYGLGQAEGYVAKVECFAELLTLFET
ncbi:MAG: HAD hydrolase-like protein [Clostridiales bacterium]|nr:HAD hydrolase-like protein [Clostridiales bacterium]